MNLAGISKHMAAATTVAVVNNNTSSRRSSVYVGGKPIPAPRSVASRQGSLTLNASLNSNSSSTLQVTKQVATTEKVARYMENVAVTGQSVDEVVEEIFNRFVSVSAVAEMWTERCLGVVKAVKERSQYGLFICSLNRHQRGVMRQELRKIAMDAFINAVRQKLHEDLCIFKYWSVMVLSDIVREVLDEDLLNDALHYLLGNDPPAVRRYLHDVAGELKRIYSDSRPPCNETNNFVRYRPLCVVHRFNNNKNIRREPDYELRTVNFDDVRKVSLEINVFCALLTGSPAKGVLFSIVSSSCTRSPLVVSDVIGAILHAELCSGTATAMYFEDNLDLLNLVIDGPERETREMLLVMEVYEALSGRAGKLRQLTSVGERVMAKLNDCVISDETRLRAKNYFETRDDFSNHYARASSAQRPNVAADGGGGNRRHPIQRR